MNDEEMLHIIQEENEDFVAITDEEMSEGGRWNNSYDQTFEQKSTGKFFNISWTRGATEYQDEGPENLRMMEVFKQQVLVTQYLAKPKECIK
jgi:hypothetical protein